MNQDAVEIRKGRALCEIHVRRRKVSCSDKHLSDNNILDIDTDVIRVGIREPDTTNIDTTTTKDDFQYMTAKDVLLDLIVD